MNNKPCFVNICLHIIGLLLCILPPALATASYFPLWINRGAESTIAGGGVLILVLCAAPLWKAVLRLLRSPSSHVMWLLLFGLFLFLSRIAEQMVVISFFGLVGNLLGAICFYIERRRREG